MAMQAALPRPAPQDLLDSSKKQNIMAPMEDGQIIPTGHHQALMETLFQKGQSPIDEELPCN